MSTFEVPPGYHKPFTTATPFDQTAWIVVAAILGIVYMVVAGLLRLWARHERRVNLDLDDLFCGFATALAIIHAAMVLAACALGLGQSVVKLPLPVREEISKIWYSSTIVFLLALGLSKITCVLAVLRLTASTCNTRIQYLSYLLVVLTGIWTFVGIIVFSTRCDMPHPWKMFGQGCNGAFHLWLGVSISDVVLDLAVVLLAVALVWPLQMSRQKKSTVVALFGLRLIRIVPVTLRLINFSVEGLARDPTLDEAWFLIWTEIDQAYSVISTSLQCLLPIVATFSTNYGVLDLAPQPSPLSSAAIALCTLKHETKSGEVSFKTNRTDEQRLIDPDNGPIVDYADTSHPNHESRVRDRLETE